MSETSVLDQGIELMLFGMGTVFVFLTILVIATIAMSTMIGRYLPEAATPAPTPTPKPAAQHGPVDSKVVKVIHAAIEQHRARD